MPSASPSVSGSFGVDVRNANLYANETFTSFFRRLTFAPDGSLLFTPAGQYKTSTVPGPESTKKDDDVLNTVYVYTRAGLNKPPVAHLPGHKKPSIAVKCSPVYYNLRANPPETKEITIDTIQKMVCEYFDVPYDKLLQKTRKREIVQARQITI